MEKANLVKELQQKIFNIRWENMFRLPNDECSFDEERADCLASFKQRALVTKKELDVLLAKYEIQIYENLIKELEP
jgi:hypothetical protein